MSEREYLFTSESVTEGHPDKMCDAISDAVLDAIIAREAELADEGYVTDKGSVASPEYVRVACETLTTTGLIVVAGEIRTHAYVDIPAIVRKAVEKIGYTRAASTTRHAASSPRSTSRARTSLWVSTRRSRPSAAKPTRSISSALVTRA